MVLVIIVIACLALVLVLSSGTIWNSDVSFSLLSKLTSSKLSHMRSWWTNWNLQKESHNLYHKTHNGAFGNTSQTLPQSTLPGSTIRDLFPSLSTSKASSLGALHSLSQGTIQIPQPFISQRNSSSQIWLPNMHPGQIIVFGKPCLLTREFNFSKK